MKEKLKQMGYKMQQSMIGRYGIDALYKALLVIYLILVVTGSALARVSRPVYTVLWVLSLAVLIYAIFRSFCICLFFYSLTQITHIFYAFI